MECCRSIYLNSSWVIKGSLESVVPGGRRGPNPRDGGRRHLSVPENISGWGKGRGEKWSSAWVSVFACRTVRGRAEETRGVYTAPGARRLRPRRSPSAEAASASCGLGRSSPAPAEPRGGLWAGGCDGLAAASGAVSPVLARPSPVGGARGNSEQVAGALRVVVAARPAAAAAPLEAGDVGEAVAAAAEAALRTRGKLLADRTPGRDVREPPLPPLTPRAELGSRGRPCAPAADPPAGAGRGREAGLGPGRAPGGGGRGAAASARRGGLEAAAMH